MTRLPLLMKVRGDQGNDLSAAVDAFSGERGVAKHLFEAWESRPAEEVARDYGDDGIAWALAVDGRWSGGEALADLGLALVVAREAASGAGAPLVLLADDLTAVQDGDQISWDGERLQLDHVDGLTTFLEGVRRS